MTSTRRIQEMEIPGLVRLDGVWHYVLGTLAEWILDYPAYDPSYDQTQWSDLFRSGLLRVGLEDGSAFLSAMHSGEIPVEELDSFVAFNSQERSRPRVLVDFDAGSFMSSFYDVALEEYSGEDWQADFGDPLADVPDEIARWWR
jgi:hypothetical protein